MTSSSDFSPMYASTSSINCERTVRSKVINASSVVFLLRLLLRTFVRSLDQSISLKRKKSTLFFGLRARRSLSLARVRGHRRSSSIAVVRLPLARTFALGTPVSTAVAMRPVPSRCRVFTVTSASTRSFSLSHVYMCKQYIMYTLARTEPRLWRADACVASEKAPERRTKRTTTIVEKVVCSHAGRGEVACV